MNPHDMDGDIVKLVALLKKILRNHPQMAEIANLMEQKKAFNLNMCFLTIVPMLPDELEELEGLYEEYMSHLDEFEGAAQKKARLEFKLNREDVSFLKKHGIRF